MGGGIGGPAEGRISLSCAWKGENASPRSTATTQRCVLPPNTPAMPQVNPARREAPRGMAGAGRARFQPAAPGLGRAKKPSGDGQVGAGGAGWAGAGLPGSIPKGKAAFGTATSSFSDLFHLITSCDFLGTLHRNDAPGRLRA